MSDAPPSSFQFRWYISVAIVLVAFVVVAVYSSRMAKETTGYDEQEGKARTEKLEKLQAADQKTLTTADWIDKDKGTVRIPIDEAMPQEVAVLQAKPAAMADAIPAAMVTAMNTIPATNNPPAAANPSGTTTNAPTANAAAPSATGTTPPSTNAPSAATNQAPTGNAPASTPNPTAK